MTAKLFIFVSGGLVSQIGSTAPEEFRDIEIFVVDSDVDCHDDANATFDGEDCHACEFGLPDPIPDTLKFAEGDAPASTDQL